MPQLFFLSPASRVQDAFQGTKQVIQTPQEAILIPLKPSKCSHQNALLMQIVDLPYLVALRWLLEVIRQWGFGLTNFFSIYFGPMKTLFRTTFDTFLNDPRVMGQEEQLSCHPLCLIWAWQVGKGMIYLPLTEKDIFSQKNVSRNICYAF